MSSFWKFFSGEEGEGEGTQAAADSAAEASPPDGSANAEGVMKPSKSPPAAAAGGANPQAPGVADGAKSAAPGSTRYGIDDAIRLMRTLPVEENVDLVVRVMKSTLESLKVRVGDIIDDASKRQDSLKKKINEYQTQIAQFEREIDARKHEIGRHEDELAETTKVKERLQIAETLAGTPQAPQAAGQARVAPPLPMRSKPPPPDLKKTPSIPPKNEIEGGSPSPSPSEPRDVEKPS